MYFPRVVSKNDICYKKGARCELKHHVLISFIRILYISSLNTKSCCLSCVLVRTSL